MNKGLLGVVAVSGFLFAATSSFGGVLVAVPDLSYSVALADGCTVATTTGLTDFGTYTTLDTVATDLPAGTVNVTCSNGLAVGICVDAGGYVGAVTANSRHLKGAGLDYVSYDLKDGIGGTSVGDLGCTAIDGAYGGDVAAWASFQSVTTSGIAGDSYDLYADIDFTTAAGVADTYIDSVKVTIVW